MRPPSGGHQYLILSTLVDLNLPVLPLLPTLYRRNWNIIIASHFACMFLSRIASHLFCLAPVYLEYCLREVTSKLIHENELSPSSIVKSS